MQTVDPQNIKRELKKDTRQLKRHLTEKDATYFKNRLDSQSRRIEKLQRKLAQIQVNHRYYINKRLPDVLKREKAKIQFSVLLQKAERLLRAFGKTNLAITSNSKDPEKRQQRSVGLFTHVEMQRLRRLLTQDFRVVKNNIS